MGSGWWGRASWKLELEQELKEKLAQNKNQLIKMLRESDFLRVQIIAYTI